MSKQENNSQAKAIAPSIVVLLQEVPKQQAGNVNVLQRGLDEMFTNYFKNNNFLDNGGENTTNEVVESYHFLGKIIKEANHFFNRKTQ